jgi:hypothetical protein
MKNTNSEEMEWEEKILRYGWSQKHTKLFDQVVKILDYDRLARLANVDNKRYEAVQRRIAIDKSANRMRKILAAVSWDTPTVQWIHGLMMEYLPPSYLAAYLDIMQTLKAKLPSLVDKMIFWKAGNVNQELLAPILKRPWQPALHNKVRTLNIERSDFNSPFLEPKTTRQCAARCDSVSCSTSLRSIVSHSETLYALHNDGSDVASAVKHQQCRRSTCFTAISGGANGFLRTNKDSGTEVGKS